MRALSLQVGEGDHIFLKVLLSTYGQRKIKDKVANICRMAY